MLKIKKDFYVSFNQDELAIMLNGGMSLEEQALYFLLKTIAHFKTGVFGKFRQQKMSYAELGRRLSRPASQGKPARTFEASQIIRLLEQLEARKLVTERHIDEETGRLLMRLPLSPIVKKNKSEVVTADTEKLSQEYIQETPAIAGGSWVPCDSPDAPSVMFSQRENKTPLSTTANNTDEAEERPRLEPLKGGTAEGPLSEAAIEAVVRKSGGQYASTETSRRYYQAWIRRGLTGTRLDEAILWHEMFGDGLFTPADLQRFLFPKPDPQKPKRAANQSGLVL